jgi:hypothetical protein
MSVFSLSLEIALGTISLRMKKPGVLLSIVILSGLLSLDEE